MYDELTRRGMLRTGAALAIGAAFSGTASASHGGDTIVVDDDGGEDFETIQEAIDHAGAGDRIEVRTGTYEENIVIDKSVVLTADASVTIEGQVEVEADDVEIDGLAWDSFGASPILDVRGEGTVVSDIEMVEVPVDSPRSTSIEVHGDDTVIADSEFSRTGDDSHAFIALFKGANTVVADGAPDGTEIVGNELTGGDIGVFLEDGQSVTIRDNDITPADSDDDAIWVTGPGYTALSSDVTLDIENNGELVRVDSRNTGGGARTVHYMTSLSSGFESDQSPITDGSVVTPATGTYEDDISVDFDRLTLEGDGAGVVLTGEIQIEANDVALTDLTFVEDPDGRNHGIRIGNDASNIDVSDSRFVDKRRGIAALPANDEDGTVRNSEFVGCRTGIYSADSNLSVEGSLFEDCTAGVGGVFGDVTIEENNFEDNEEGVGVGDPGGVTINRNNFEGNDVGVKNYADEIDVFEGTVDAINNWWGHASGPGGEDGRTNPAGREVGQGDDIEGDVDFDPWLRRPVDE